MIAVVGCRIPPSVQETDSAVYVTALRAKLPFSARDRKLLSARPKGNGFVRYVCAHDQMRFPVLVLPSCKSRRSRGSLQPNSSLPTAKPRISLPDLLSWRACATDLSDIASVEGVFYLRANALMSVPKKSSLSRPICATNVRPVNAVLQVVQVRTLMTDREGDEVPCTHFGKMEAFSWKITLPHQKSASYIKKRFLRTAPAHCDPPQ